MLSELVSVIRRERLPVFRIAEYADGRTEEVTLMPSNPVNAVYSISKNVTATVIGMLMDDGVLSPDDRVWSLLGRAGCSCEWMDVTVGHVLTQTTGYGAGFLDIDADDVRRYPTKDYLRIALDTRLEYPVGQRMVYSDSNYYLLSRVAAEVSGEPLQELAAERLFEPLEFQGWAWATCPHGHAMGGTGLYLRLCDQLKLGVLYAEHGVWNGQRLLSGEWIRKATAPLIRCGRRQYGYSFWRAPHSRAYYGAGVYGQMLYIDPERRHVVAWQGFDAENRTKQLLELLLAHSASDV